MVLEDVALLFRLAEQVLVHRWDRGRTAVAVVLRLVLGRGIDPDVRVSVDEIPSHAIELAATHPGGKLE